MNGAPATNQPFTQDREQIRVPASTLGPIDHDNCAEHDAVHDQKHDERDKKRLHGSLYSCWMLPLYVTTIALPRLHGLLRMGPSIRRQRSTHIYFLIEMPFVVAADIPLVALVRFDQLSLRHHDALLVTDCAVIRGC